MEPEFTGVLGVVILAIVGLVMWPRGGWARTFVIPHGFAGLLYDRSELISVLPPGRYVRWGRYLECQVQDLRTTSLVVAGPEVVTLDNVGLRLSLIVSCQLVDPAKVGRRSRCWQGDVCTAAQRALVVAVGSLKAETVLNHRPRLGAQLRAEVHEEVIPAGIKVHAVEVVYGFIVRSPYRTSPVGEKQLVFSGVN